MVHNPIDFESCSSVTFAFWLKPKLKPKGFMS